MTQETKDLIRFKVLKAVVENVFIEIPSKEKTSVNYYDENDFDNHGTHKKILDNLIYQSHINKNNAH